MFVNFISYLISYWLATSSVLFASNSNIEKPIVNYYGHAHIVLDYGNEAQLCVLKSQLRNFQTISETYHKHHQIYLFSEGWKNSSMTLEFVIPEDIKRNIQVAFENFDIKERLTIGNISEKQKEILIQFDASVVFKVLADQLKLPNVFFFAAEHTWLRPERHLYPYFLEFVNELAKYHATLLEDPGIFDASNLQEMLQLQDIKTIGEELGRLNNQINQNYGDVVVLSYKGTADFIRVLTIELDIVKFLVNKKKKSNEVAPWLFEMEKKLQDILEIVNFAIDEVRDNYLSALVESHLLRDPQKIVYISYGRSHTFQSLVNSDLFTVEKLNDSNLASSKAPILYSDNIQAFIKKIVWENKLFENILLTGRYNPNL